MFFQLKPPKCKSLRPIVATMNSKILGVWNYSRMVHDANAKLKYGKVIWQELWNLRLHHKIQSGGQANKIKKKKARWSATLPVICTSLLKLHFWRGPGYSKYDSTCTIRFNPCRRWNCCTNCITRRWWHAGRRIEIFPLKLSIL